MTDSVRWMIEKLNHPELYQPWPLWLQHEVARQNAERDAERALLARLREGPREQP